VSLKAEQNDQASASAPVSLDQVTWMSASAMQLQDAIANRATHCLDPMNFASPAFSSDLSSSAALTRSALVFASALAGGATDPSKPYDICTVPRPKVDLRVAAIL
jgi:L,D-transpeptidase YcbB